METQEIIAKLETIDGTFPREAFESAIKNKEEIAPYLIEILHLVIKEASEFKDNSEFWGHIFSMFLLAQFREKEAYQPIVDFFSLPGDLVFDLTGDVVIEDLKKILASVSNGDTTLIKQLIENKNANEDK